MVDIRTSDGTTTITITGDGTVKFADDCENLPATAVNTVVTGPLTQAVWTEIMANKGGWNTQAANGQVIDLKGVTGLTTSELLNVGMFSSINGTNNTNYIILPTDSDVPTALQTKSNTTPSFDNWDSLKYFIIPQTDGSCKVVIVDLDGQSYSAYTTSIISHLVLGAGIKKVEVLAITDDDQNPATIANKEAVEAALVNAGYELKQAALTVDGCAVTVNMNGAEAGQTLANLIATAKAAVIAGGQTGICTLIVTGPVTNNDLVALGGTNMTGATRIDLSDATMGTGVTIDNLKIPASLVSLVLPKGQTVSVSLASKLTAATNLKYAYSPTSSSSRTVAEQFSPDYVYVLIPGSLSTAVSNEEGLRKGVYIKIATPSGVNLSNDDANFGSMGIDVTDATNYGWQYVDMSDAGVTAEASLAATAPHNKGYRIILPDNLTGNHMAIFASNTNHGSVAALYSYTGTTLRILELTDGSYREDALRDPRIIIPGTDAIEVVTGTYNSTTYGTFGQTSTTTNNILSAINGAASSIKSVTISNVTTASSEPLTFSNTNLTTIQLDGVKSLYDGVWGIDGPIVNVNNNCLSLATLNLIDCQIESVTANNPSLTSVNLSGTGVNGDTDLSGSGLKTLTTNSDTWIQGDLHLESTESFTSFASTAKLGTNSSSNGNIYLNHSGVSTVDLQSVQFQNTSSKIHIHKTANEEDTNVLDALNADGQLTIYIPTGFDRTRLHPYPMVGETAVLADNIAELAPSSAFEDTCEPDHCKIIYDADTHVATVYCYTPGHFKTLMEKDNNYGKFVDGAIFTFDASCKLNAADLAALAGKDGYGNFNWNFVDLYNLPVSYEHESKTYTYDDIITEAINILRTKNWQYKGLLLPKTTAKGTTLIQDRTEDATKLATCSQSIAYSGTIGTGENSKVLTASYIYKAADDYGIDYQARLLNLEKMMNLHDEIVTKTQYYSVSTNSATPLDLSTIPATATVNESTINTSKLETVNNDMVTSTSNKPSIYAYPAYEGVMLDVMTSSGIGNTTNLELLMVDGPLSANDIASVNNFNFGPRVLDLREADVDGGITKEMLESITNDDIEYIILPAGMTKDVVCGANYTDGLKNGKLKAVISSTSTNLVAYVNTPGSLAEARYLATGGSINNNLMFPTITGLQSVTLTGNLNAADIAANTTTHHVDASGHWVSGGANATSIALSGEQGTITTIDLRGAVFEEYTPTGGKLTSDMNFSYAGLASLHDIILPTSNEMTLIPAECFMGITTFNDLCIPYNYKKIDNAALLNAYCGHITTTDANGALIDNGEHSYTFSANLEEIGTKPATPDANGVYSLDRVVFPQNRGVTDVYVLAHQVPKCYANAFPANMLYGWGGFKGGTFPYCREKYDNSADGSMIFTVLHFPDEASYNTSTDTDKEKSYNIMKQKYTDVTKVYSMKEQTGAVDANGDAIFWPTFSELRRAYNQASDGIIWDDWVANYDSNHEVNGGDFIPTSSQADASTPGEGNHSPLITVSTVGYNFTNYEGWHQFTLSQATYVEPDKIVNNEIVTNEYVEPDRWYTFCIPFSITADQLKEILGVPASTATVKSKVYKKDGITVVEEESTGHNPEARTLNSVERKPGTPNEVTFNFTQPLVQDNNDTYFFWNINESSPAASGVAACGNTEKNKVIALRGGLPYIIKPYLPKGVTVKNLGQYVMQRFGKMFTEDQACGNLGTDYYEQLGTRNKLTSRFVKPYEKHKIQAFYDKGDNTSGYYTHTNSKKYNYAFIGQFWEQDLPRYSFYVVNGKWYRYASGNKGYKLAPYKCVIMCSPEDDDDAKPNSGKYRSASRSNFPNVVKELDDDDIFNGVFNLGFLDGLDDSDFNEGTHSSRESNYIFSLDEDIIEYDENGNQVTSIDNLDGEDLKPAISDGKIYNMAGQYVGKSPEDLSKGMYILNGKKFVVK